MFPDASKDSLVREISVISHLNYFLFLFKGHVYQGADRLPAPDER